MLVARGVPDFVTQSIRISTDNGHITVSETHDRQAVVVSIFESKCSVSASPMATIALNAEQWDALVETRYKLTVNHPAAPEAAPNIVDTKPGPGPGWA